MDYLFKGASNQSSQIPYISGFSLPNRACPIVSKQDVREANLCWNAVLIIDIRHSAIFLVVIDSKIGVLMGGLTGSQTGRNSTKDLRYGET